MSLLAHGFEPVFNQDSKALILGSFPSVKSRAVQFYYGHPQNRFWKVLAEFFGEPLPQTVEERKNFALSHGIALWDVVASCEIKGSSDATIKNYQVADLQKLVDNTQISVIMLNGTKAYEIYQKHFAQLNLPTVCLPSTSPANTRFEKEVWFDNLSQAFSRT